jgi:hypothetical protein
MLTVTCTSVEADVIDEMKRLCGLATDADLVRTALWSFADFLELDPPATVFDLRPRGHQSKRTATRPHPKAMPAKTVIRKAQKPAASHPWRLPLADLLRRD